VRRGTADRFARKRKRYLLPGGRRTSRGRRARRSASGVGQDLPLRASVIPLWILQSAVGRYVGVYE
jgi:hypothetical protein